MEQQPDAQQFLQRAGEVAKEIRKSEAYPALVGALAGGIVAALIAVIIANRVSSVRRAKVAPAPEATPTPPAKTSWLASWTLKDLAQLISVAAPLVKQANEMYQARRKPE